jgi:hypothetical protein|tara:strand:- start:516 stop:620 length:105 start_codon:yes stop_codon:yes gene_type:complete
VLILESAWDVVCPKELNPTKRNAAIKRVKKAFIR